MRTEALKQWREALEGSIAITMAKIDLRNKALKSIDQAIAEVDRSVEDWGIDTSAGRPILVYKKCSVIEGDDAYFLLDLIRRANQELKSEKQEPVAQVCKMYVNNILWLNQIPEVDTLLYTHPQPKREPADSDLLDDARAVLEIIVHDQPADNFRDARALIPQLRERLGMPPIINFTHPQPKREPLTLEQRKAIQDEQEWPQMCDPYMYWFFKGVDAAEAAHGIPGVDKTAKQRHKWVGLTDEERRIIINDWQWQEGKPYHLCLSIEAKLKEKNT